MTSGRLNEQIRFILEIDKLKGVLRRTYLADGTRALGEHLRGGIGRAVERGRLAPPRD